MAAPVTRSEQEVLARRWSASGAMALTGRSAGPPLVAPAAVVARMVELGERAGVQGDALGLLGERAAFASLSRQGERSCGGASRLLRATDGWAVVTLARDDDVDLVPAWLETAADVEDPWAVVGEAFAGRPGAALVERGRMLGLPVAMVASVVAPRRGGGEASSVTEPGLADLPMLVTRYRQPAGRRSRVRSSPLVVDLSSLWAGPLSARLLGDAGAEVVKVESVHRPDGARRGPGGFFDVLHGGHRSVALDFRTAEGVDVLGRLLAAADVVIEGSRPRALAQLGLAPEDLLARGDGPKVWISITGYGRTGQGRHWVGFGDDAAAAGGLVAWDGAGPCFVADAVADPLSGLVAAAAAHVALEADGTWLVDVALADVAAHVARGGGDPSPGTEVREPDDAGTPRVWASGVDAAPPSRPPVPRRGPTLGEHTDEILSWLEPASRSER